MAPKGLYDYFVHAENPEKTPYNIEDIESGCGFDLDKFIIENNSDNYYAFVIDLIEEYNFKEFKDLFFSWYTGSKNERKEAEIALLLYIYEIRKDS